MAQIRIETEIEAPPEDVRSIVLDFERYSEWHRSFIASISAVQSSSKLHELLQGQTLNAKIGGVELVPIIESNTSTELSWHGSTFGGAFAGKHYFQFFESHITPGGTTFVHGEDYDGWMTWMFGQGVLGVARKRVMRMYENYSKDLKRRAESMAKLKKTIDETQKEPWIKM